MKRLLLAIASVLCTGLFLFPATHAAAQTGTADKIVAVVGRNRIILRSELEQQIVQYRQQDSSTWNDTMRCYILQQMMMSKMLVEQAERDSLIVSDEDVDAELENRMRYFIRAYGGQDRMEQALGKTVYQIKQDYRDPIRENMQATKVREQILQHIKITPAEVQAFYNKQDTLPFFPATVEVGQLVIDPATSPELDQYAKQTIEEAREKIVKGGESFEDMAGRISMDPGSRDVGGRIDGVTRNGELDQTFTTAAFRLQKEGDVSPVIKTQFGYHIIQLIQRRGDQIDIRHILIIPQHSSADYKAALQKLDSVRSLLIAGKYTFSEAVGKFSNNESSKLTAGMIVDPNTNNSQLQIDQLDPAMALIVDSLQPGGFSMPQQYSTTQDVKSTRIIYLKSRSKPHRANLKDDYNRIQTVALEQKKAEKLQQWLNQKLPSYYIKISPEYLTCNSLKQWVNNTAAAK